MTANKPHITKREVIAPHPKTGERRPIHRWIVVAGSARGAKLSDAVRWVMRKNLFEGNY